MDQKTYLETIAATAHEMNKTYCESLGDTSQVGWLEAPDWQKKSAIAGVDNTLRNPDLTPEKSHEMWMRHKLDEGWKYGKVKDADLKTHPCLIPYGMLPKEQQVKDIVFITSVRTMAGLIEKASGT